MDWATILLTAGTALGGSGSLFLWLETRGERGSKRRTTKRLAEVNEVIEPVKKELTEVHAKLDHMHDHTSSQVKAALYEALEPVKDQLTQLNTKVEPLWSALVQGALHNAEVLHHPEPARAELDMLLDHFRDNILTAEEELLLKRYLTQIKNWETGQDIGFPVYASEPSAAANLLAMLDLVKLYRKRAKS